jgi:hypothetical protein
MAERQASTPPARRGDVRRHANIASATELVYLPRPSWAPAFFALGAALMVIGIFAEGFVFSAYIYAIVGAVIALAALRSLTLGAARDFRRLPRRQRSRSAVIPPVSFRRPPG